jgi:hypothetical protein
VRPRWKACDDFFLDAIVYKVRDAGPAADLSSG